MSTGYNMGDGGKGSARRPQQVDEATFDRNWDQIFQRKNKKDAELQEEALRSNQDYDEWEDDDENR